MIIFDSVKVDGFEAAIRGMRNPMNSWDKSDSYFGVFDEFKDEYHIGENDYNLAMALASQGPVHGKFRRMITVSVDITAPLYWWKEYDTYKVGTVANSCSTMHKLADKLFSRDDFSCELLENIHDCGDNGCQIHWFSRCLDDVIDTLNKARELYLKTKDVTYWNQMLQLLPTSYNQKRTVLLNYEVLSGIYYYRKDHKLSEWRYFCEWIKTLPYSEFILADCEEDAR